MNIQKVPKQFCENIKLAFAEDYFVIALFSGETASIYALSPQHAKKLHQYLGVYIDKYEKQFGEINAVWVEGVKSPIQSTDLSDQEGKGGKSD